MSGEALKGHLELLLLAVLQPRPAHGYAIIEELRRRSGGAFDLPEGTVYPALHRLERDGLVTSGWDTGAARKRRVYALTPAGAGALAAKHDQWREFARAVQSVVGRVAAYGPAGTAVAP